MTMPFGSLFSSVPVLVLAVSAAHAQSPARQITLVVPYTAASDADLAARNLAEYAPRYLGGQKIVVVNQPGASGSIGTQAVRSAAPDGYTLLLARTASFVILPATDRKTPYQWGDFTLLSMMEINPIVCAVRADSPYFAMQGLLDDIRKRPGKLNFATVGQGTIQNFGPQYLSRSSACPGTRRWAFRTRALASSSPPFSLATSSSRAAISARFSVPSGPARCDRS